MSEREQLIRDLRTSIKEGATVPKCLRVICKRLGIGNMAAIDFFRAAFRLGLGTIHKAAGGYQRADADNTQRGLATLLVLPLVVQNRDEWDERPSQLPDNWFYSLTCSTSESIATKALASIQGDRDWEQVPESVREHYLTAERSRLVLSEFSEIVSRLAERLQLRVDELEREKQELSTRPPPDSRRSSEGDRLGQPGGLVPAPGPEPTLSLP